MTDLQILGNSFCKFGKKILPKLIFKGHGHGACWGPDQQFGSRGHIHQSSSGIYRLFTGSVRVITIHVPMPPSDEKNGTAEVNMYTQIKGRIFH